MKKRNNMLLIKMKKVKLWRVIALSLASVIVLNANIIVRAAETSEFSRYEDEISAIMEEKRSFYLNDQEFYLEANERGVSFEELLRLNAISTYQNRIDMMNHDEMSVRDLGNNGNNVSTNIPLIMQTTTYNCGPTSGLQVLYGMGCQSLIPGQTNADKIQQLMLDCDTDSSGTYVYKLKNGLNKYASRAYEYILGTSMTESQFQGKVETSLFYNTAPIIHARTAYLPYYNGHASGHYIAISEVDKANATIRLKDCNNNSAYYGQHIVSVNDAYKAINEESSRYLICMQY